MVACAHVVLFCALHQPLAQAEEWSPEKTITIIAPSNPGGGWDQTARFLQHTIANEELSPVGFEVVNRGGAGGTIGLGELIERYEGDPYKLMITGFGMNGAVVMHGSRHSLLEATPIARLTGEYQALAVPVASPFQTLDDFIDALRASPENISVGGGSAGGADQIFATIVAEKVGVEASKLNYVAFTGGGEAAAALLGGQVSAGVSGYAEWGSLIDAGRVRLLAVSSPDRIVDPDLPTFRELGIDVEFQNWRGIVAAPGISDQQRAWLTTVIAKARASDTWKGILKRNNWQDSYQTGRALEDFITAEKEIIRDMLTRAGMGAGGKGYAAVGPYFFPTVIGLGLAACALFFAYSRLRSGSISLRPLPVGDNTVAGATPDIRRFCFAAFTCVLYIVALRYVGFLIATPLFIVTVSRIIGSRAPVRDLIVGVALSVAIALVFENLLSVDIP
ncbi:MAG: tripartite tricarboxylate transporter TctB family protein [Sphingomonadales bacterium]|nr:tripartite tricarboxylate transporter TctB family protein [Sphingomonadales bacterium]